MKKLILIIALTHCSLFSFCQTPSTFTINYYDFFYGLWMIIIGSVFALVFFLIWKKKKAEVKKDRIEGIWWFSAAMCVWGVSGIWTLVTSAFFNNESWLLVLGNSILSSLNSMFILYAIPSIEIESKWVREKVLTRLKDKFQIGISFFLISILTVTSFLIIYHGIYKGNIEEEVVVINWIYFTYIPDILASLITIIILVIVLREAFKEREMQIMIWVAYVTLLITLFAQLILIAPAWIPKDEIYYLLYNLFATSFKTCLIALILILIYSWEVKRTKELLLEQEIKFIFKIKELKNTNEKQRNNFKLLEQETKEKLSNQKNEPNQNESSLIEKDFSQSDISRLTEREKEVFERLSKDLTYNEIGKELFIAKSTVISNVRSIEKKLNIKGKGNLIIASKKYHK